MTTTIAIGADHAGFAYKEAIKQWLQERGYIVQDFGTHSDTSTDYPDYAHPLANAIQQGSINTGILLCGSANGVAITANKHARVRAALCWQTDIARLARQHNDANVLCLPARFISLQNAIDMVQIFLTTDFEGKQHTRRIQKIEKTSNC